MESYVVRIYRREPGSIAGVVEFAGGAGSRSFHSYEELRALLDAPTEKRARGRQKTSSVRRKHPKPVERRRITHTFVNLRRWWRNFGAVTGAKAISVSPLYDGSDDILLRQTTKTC